MPVEDHGEEVQAEPSEKALAMPSKPANPTAKPDETTTEKLEKDIERGEWWLIRIGFATLFINTIIALIYVRQLQAMRDANELTRAALKTAAQNSLDSSSQFQVQLQHFDAGLGRTEVLAKHTEDQAKASQDAANAARSLADTSIFNSRQDQRAWIGVQDFTLEAFKPHEETRIRVIVVNTGKTPALAVRAGIKSSGVVPSSWNAEQVEKEISKQEGLLELQSSSIIPPQGPFRMNLSDRVPLTEQDSTQIETGQGIEYVVGRVEYRDIFHRPQWLNFCLQIFGEHGRPILAACNTGSDMSYENHQKK